MIWCAKYTRQRRGWREISGRLAVKVVAAPDRQLLQDVSARLRLRCRASVLTNLKYAGTALAVIVESHMKQLEEESMKTLRVASLLTGMTALLVSGAAMAGVNVGINVGVPAPVYVAPAPVYAPPPPPVVYQPAPV